MASRLLAGMIGLRKEGASANPRDLIHLPPYRMLLS